MKRIIFALVLGLVFSIRVFAEDVFEIPVMGKSIHIFDQSAGEKKPWYINDHCIIKGPDGRYHVFGITHEKALIPPSWSEHTFAHASADELFQIPWQKHPRVLDVDKNLGETHLWAPHIIEKDGTYYMFYAGGGKPWDSMINLATSKDLFKWERSLSNPMFRDFFDARDPMVIKFGQEYLMYYCKTYSRKDYRSTVAIRRSKDLIHWSEPEFALVLSDKPLLINSGHTESPYVFEHNGKFYLAVCTPFYHYRLTRVFVSDNPYRFDERNEVTSFIAHCAEILNFDGKWYLSHAGWFYDGVYLAPITWIKAKKFEPQFIFVNAGETEDFLVERSKTVKIGSVPLSILTTNAFLKILPGGFARYEIPVPTEANQLQLFISGKGAYEIFLKDEKLSLSRDQTSFEGLDLYWLDDKSKWSDGKLELRVKPAGNNSSYELNFLRIYFIN